MPVSPAEAAATLARRHARERARDDAWACEIRSRLPAAAKLLRERHGVAELWIFGSFAWGRPHEGSDVDLAVSAVIPEYFRALADLVELLDADVDLVELPAAAPSLTTRILRDGVPL